MSDRKEKVFPKGIFFKEHKQEWIDLAVSINRKECIEWLTNETGDYINIDVKTSKAGNIYGEVNTWKPITDTLCGGANFQEAIDKQKNENKTAKDDFDKDDIPF